MGFTMIFMGVDGDTAVDADRDGLARFLAERGVHLSPDGDGRGIPIAADGRVLFLDGGPTDMHFSGLDHAEPLTGSIWHAHLGPEECAFVYDMCIAARWIVCNAQGGPTYLIPGQNHTPAQLRGIDAVDEIAWVDSAEELREVLSGGFEDFVAWRDQVLGRSRPEALSATLHAADSSWKFSIQDQPPVLAFLVARDLCAQAVVPEIPAVLYSGGPIPELTIEDADAADMPAWWRAAVQATVTSTAVDEGALPERIRPTVRVVTEHLARHPFPDFDSDLPMEVRELIADVMEERSRASAEPLHVDLYLIPTTEPFTLRIGERAMLGDYGLVHDAARVGTALTELLRPEQP